MRGVPVPVAVRDRGGVGRRDRRPGDGAGATTSTTTRSSSDGPPLGLALIAFLLAWQVMIAAMMLPSSLPLVRLFAAASRRQPRPGTRVAAFLGGYALVWSAFGALALAFDLGVHRQ